MGKYLYRSHMGGLFATDEHLSFEDRYCEQCGDTDDYIGFANNMQDAWNLIKDECSTFDEEDCKKCEHNGDDDYCNEHCEAYQHCGGYNLTYAMNFLKSEFEDMWKPHYIYLLIQREEDKNYVMVNIQPAGCKFGDKHILPSNFSLNPNFSRIISKELVSAMDGCAIESPKICGVKELKDKYIMIYSCVEKADDSNWKDAAHYREDGWYAYMHKDNLKLSDEEKQIINEFLK